MKKQVVGFTLIELLISISLLSMIMLLASWSFSIFIERWEGRLGNFSQAVSESKDFILLNNVISTTIPYIIEQDNSLGYYFISSENTIESVSQNGIFHTLGPVFFKLTVETKLTGEQYLLYQEGELTGQLMLEQDLPYSHEKILIDDSQSIKLQVLAWSSVLEKMNSEDPLIKSKKSPQWLTQYNAWHSKIMPISLRVTWNNSVTELTFINDQGRLLNVMTELKDFASAE